MPGYLLSVSAQVQCLHSGKATPIATNASVQVDGQPTVLVNASYTVAGCTLPPPSAGNGPCVSAQWLSGTTRVTSNGQALLYQSSQGTCAPPGTGLQIVSTQTRASAT